MIGRECWRKKSLTIDAIYFIGLSLTVFWDTVVNFLQPTFLYSSHWLNLNDWWGHAPLVINPAAGHMISPILFVPLAYTGFSYWVAISGCAYIRWMLRRRPNASLTRVVIELFVTLTVVFAGLVWLADILHAWGTPGMPPFALSDASDTLRFSVFELLYGGYWFVVLVLLRFQRKPTDKTITDRGVDNLPAKWRLAVRILAITGSLAALGHRANSGVRLARGASHHSYPLLSTTSRE